ncbi:MAG TPA: hypothetical protein DCY39_09655 [Exiguobacterium sp.]|nr:hypothetical protein [Exiguobacterium sp.]
MGRDRKPSCFRTLARSSSAQGPSKKAAADPRLPPRFGSKQGFSLAGYGSLRPGALSAFFDLSLRSPLRRLATLAAFPSTGRTTVFVLRTAYPKGDKPSWNYRQFTRIRQEVREPDVTLETTHITSPEDAFCVAKRFIQDDDREVFLVILLNTKNRVIAVHRAHVGSINSSVVHPREIFKSAILNNATSLIVSHQHPSGDPHPSREDIEVTERLVEVGRIVGIQLLDHIIVGAGEEYVSLKAQGVL